MGGLPKVQQVRSLSRYGLSQVTVVFEDGTDIYWARQLARAPRGRERRTPRYRAAARPIVTGWARLHVDAGGRARQNTPAAVRPH
jgi:cobalt-zinc-cadmium resistance protein CzcA